MTTSQLFDKQINITLRKRPGGANFSAPGQFIQNPQAQIFTPETGRKPKINLTGKWVAQDLLQQMEIRITNFSSDVPLSDYLSATIDCGYRGAMHASITGQIVNSFQETPGPDGVTTFQMMIGHFTDWMTRPLTVTYTEGTPVKTILTDACSALGINLRYHGDPTLVTPCGFMFNGMAKDVFPKIRQLFYRRDSNGNLVGLMIMPFGDDLVVWTAGKGTENVYRLDFITHAKHNAAGFDIQAPWIPTIHPGDFVQVEPKFFRQDFGGSLVQPGNLFQVYMLQFELDTVDDINRMTLLTLGAA
jgi:hypothetical protein